MSSDWYSRLAKARHIASPFHHDGPCSFEMPAKKIDHAHVYLDQSAAPGWRRSRPAPGPSARLAVGPASGRARSAAPLGPIARYSVSMTLIWSRPNKAAGTRLAYEIGDQERQHRRHPGPEPEREQREDHHRERIGRPHPPVGHQKPERIGVRIRLDRSHQGRRQPARRGEEVVKRQAPDGVGVERASGRSGCGSSPAGSGRPGCTRRRSNRRPPTAQSVDSNRRRDSIVRCIRRPRTRALVARRIIQLDAAANHLPVGRKREPARSA